MYQTGRHIFYCADLLYYKIKPIKKVTAKKRHPRRDAVFRISLYEKGDFN